MGVVAVDTASHEGVIERKKNRRPGCVLTAAVMGVVAVDTANHEGVIERKKNRRRSCALTAAVI